MNSENEKKLDEVKEKMNPILKKKLDEIEKADKYECWYFVKQKPDFCGLCYAVSFLKEYKSLNLEEDCGEFIDNKLAELKAAKSFEVPDNYRSIRAAAFLGLVIMESSKYKKAIITETFEEITERCNGAYENKELYADIIQRQLEKMFISSELDEKSESARKDYRLYPVMLLYKILLELGRSSGEYSISMTEYNSMVITTKTFEDFLETLLLIKLLREDKDLDKAFKNRFDSRVKSALENLETLIIDKDSISLNPNKIEEAARKVFVFEQNPNIFKTDDYIEFLGSTKSLFDLADFEGKSDENSDNKSSEVKYHTNLQSEFPRNRILFGAPGTGKSYTINKDVKALIGEDNETDYERVTFHPDYSYAHFVGTYKPVPTVDKEGNDIITYEYVPGPFMRVYVNALNNSKTENVKPFVLIIEEINRANVAAVFGDIFQLLDRTDDYVSEYPIQASEDIKKYLAKELGGQPKDYTKIRIPDNMFIWATMNSADQGVFPMDTAFKRRWDFTYLGIDDSDEKICGKYVYLAADKSQKVEWNKLRKAINHFMAKEKINEDKQLGPYFISKNMAFRSLWWVSLCEIP